MSYYSELAKRAVKACFPEVKPTQVIPVTYLEPLDAKNIIKQDMTDINTNKLCFALSDAHERCGGTYNSHTYISDEEAWRKAALVWDDTSHTNAASRYSSDGTRWWEVASAWTEAKTRAKDSATNKTASQTDTDETYYSDDSEFGVPIQPVRKSSLFVSPKSDDEDDFSDAPPRWSDQQTEMKMEDWVEAAMTAWAAAEEMEAVDCAVAAAMTAVERAVTTLRVSRAGIAATIIQAAARGRAVRAWSVWVSSASADGLEETWDALVTQENVVTQEAIVAWEAVVAWAEAKAQEREAATNT
jgi:hypothetical protein